MEPKLVNKPEITLVGIVTSGTTIQDINIPQAWDKFIKSFKIIPQRIPDRTYEVHIDDNEEPKRHYCFIGMEVQRIVDVPNGMFAKILPAGRYALFTHHFRDGGFSQAFKSVYDWLEKSPYGAAHQFDIQYYDQRFKGPDNPESILDIYLPIKPK
jgi:AraC family transcriptional regulator